ncbi:MAG: class I SAM-dependent methyltransferase [Phycisphaerales bacterium]
MSLRTRTLVGELMDDPTLDRREHELALRGLARLNLLSAAARPFVHTLQVHAKGRCFDLLDVASGSGDVLLGTARALRRRGVDVRANACDVSPVACERIALRAERAGIPVRVFTADALAEGALGERAYDGVMNTLFLHHLTRDDAVRLLRSMARALRVGGVLVASDLLRTRRCYAMALAASRLVTRSRVVHVDALRSVRAAFAADELRGLASEAGLSGARVSRVWPERGLLVWVKR